MTMAIQWKLIGYWLDAERNENNPSPTVLLSTYLTWQHIGGIPPEIQTDPNDSKLSDAQSV